MGSIYLGRVDRWVGGTARYIGLTSIDGSNDRTCFAFHQSALGVAVGMPASTEINYIAEKTSFLVTAKLSMGSIAIDTDGIVDVVCREA